MTPCHAMRALRRAFRFSPTFVLLLVSVACGDSSTAPSNSDAPVEMFVGKLAGGTELVAIAVNLNSDGTKRVRAYVCDGEPNGDVAWFVGSFGTSAVDLTSTAGEAARLVASLGDDQIAGTISIQGGPARAFTATKATHGEGVFQITVTAPGTYSGTSLSGATFSGKLEPWSDRPANSTVCGDQILAGSITAADKTERPFEFTELSRCSATELARIGIPQAFATSPQAGPSPGKFTAIIDWENDGYRRVFGRSFSIGDPIFQIPSIGTVDLLNTRVFTNSTITPIPDNNPTGASVSITVASDFTFSNLAVSVDIEHPFRGDLIVTLLRNGVQVRRVLSNNVGGSTDNIIETYQLTPLEIGSNQGKATWTLKVVDNAAGDAGRIRSFRLTFTP
jgi:proprotein convertase P-domain-containing protein